MYQEYGIEDQYHPDSYRDYLEERFSLALAQQQAVIAASGSGGIAELTDEELMARVQQELAALYDPYSPNDYTLSPFQWGQSEAAGQVITYQQTRGSVYYELSNHLGNVLVTISNQKIGIEDGSTGQALYYEATVVSVNDYYPFGWGMSGRKYNEPDYRYGFNGVEKVLELGEGHNTTFFREQDTRIARWWSIDPKVREFESPYVMMGNNPILYNDILGDTVRTFGGGADPIRTLIHNTFNKKEHKMFRDLIVVNGNDLQSIDEGEFAAAISHFNKDEKALAYGYYKAINDNNVHQLEIASNKESLVMSEKTLKAAKQYAIGKGLDPKEINYTADVNRLFGGGFNVSTSTGTFSFIIKDSKSLISYGNTKWISSPEELLAHELLGHGLGRVSNSNTYRHEDAIQLTNLYLRVKGDNKRRNGEGHGGYLSNRVANAIPVFLKTPNSIDLKIQNSRSYFFFDSKEKRKEVKKLSTPPYQIRVTPKND